MNGTDFSHKSPWMHSSKGFRWRFINDIAASVEEQEREWCVRVWGMKRSIASGGGQVA